jgi:hypothetical protein
MYSPRSASPSIFLAYAFASDCFAYAFVTSLPSGSSQTASHRFASLPPPLSGCLAVLCRSLTARPSGPLTAFPEASLTGTSENQRSLTLAI